MAEDGKIDGLEETEIFVEEDVQVRERVRFGAGEGRPRPD